MIDFEITKTQKIKEVKNSMCHNYYYLVYGRIYNENKTKYRKFKYVECFDIFDVKEFFEDKEYITKKDVEEYKNNVDFKTYYID